MPLELDVDNAAITIPLSLRQTYRKRRTLSGESFIQKRETFANTDLHATTTAAARAINMTHFSRTEPPQ